MVLAEPGRGVDGEDLVYLFVGIGVDTFTVVNAGVIDQHRQRPVFSIQPLKHRQHLRFVANIGLQQDATAAAGTKLSGKRLSCAMVLLIIKPQRITLLRKKMCTCFANT